MGSRATVLLPPSIGNSAEVTFQGYLPLDEETALVGERADMLIALDEALDRLGAMNERLSRVVECRYFGGLSLEQQKRMLLMTLDETAQLDAEIDKLLAAWRGGDIESLASTLSAEYERFPELYGPLTENRNRAWMTRLVDLLDDDDDYLVVVGALHLVGRNSVVELLEQRGYEVVQR